MDRANDEPWIDVWTSGSQENVIPLQMCPASLTSGGIVEKCRPLRSAGACESYLGEGGMYYILDTPWAKLSTTTGANYITHLHDILDTVMSPNCVSNVMDLACNSLFKTCSQVEGDWVPSLLCQSDCEKHFEVWGNCVENIEADPFLKEDFAAQMHFLTNSLGDIFNDHLQYDFGFPTENLPNGEWSPFGLLQCSGRAQFRVDRIPDEDRVTAFILGGHPFMENVHFYKYSSFFPEGMSEEWLYPETATTYTNPEDGRVYSEVPCYHLPDYSVEEVACPGGFLPPTDASNPRVCILPCPVPAFSDSEYSTMFMASSAIGLFGMLLNLWMAATWSIGGYKYFKAQHLNLKMCVFLGILYSLVETLPVLVLGFSLPCTNDTVEDVGSSVMCGINRMSIYILLAVMINLWYAIVVLFILDRA
jgi:hypothetical protein